MFIRGAVVVAVVDTIANIVLCNAASVVTSKLCVWVTRSEQTAHFIAIVPAVIVMVAAVVVGHTSPIATSKHSRLTGVEGCQTESRRDQSSGQKGEVEGNGGLYTRPLKLILPDKAIKDDSSCGTACKDKYIDSGVSTDLCY